MFLLYTKRLVFHIDENDPPAPDNRLGRYNPKRSPEIALILITIITGAEADRCLRSGSLVSGGDRRPYAAGSPGDCSLSGGYHHRRSHTAPCLNGYHRVQPHPGQQADHQQYIHEVHRPEPITSSKNLYIAHIGLSRTYLKGISCMGAMT